MLPGITAIRQCQLSLDDPSTYVAPHGAITISGPSASWHLPVCSQALSVALRMMVLAVFPTALMAAVHAAILAACRSQVAGPRCPTLLVIRRRLQALIVVRPMMVFSCRALPDIQARWECHLPFFTISSGGDRRDAGDNGSSRHHGHEAMPTAIRHHSIGVESHRAVSISESNAC